MYGKGMDMSASETRTCSVCGEEGHNRRSCDISPDGPMCSVCGFQGHDKRDCPRT